MNRIIGSADRDGLVRTKEVGHEAQEDPFLALCCPGARSELGGRLGGTGDGWHLLVRVGVENAILIDWHGCGYTTLRNCGRLRSENVVEVTCICS